MHYWFHYNIENTAVTPSHCCGLVISLKYFVEGLFIEGFLFLFFEVSFHPINFSISLRFCQISETVTAASWEASYSSSTGVT